MISYYDNLKTLNLDNHAYNAITRRFGEDVTIKDICSLTLNEIANLRGIGEKGLQYIIDIFHSYGFYFADEVKNDNLVSSEQKVDELMSRKEKINQRITLLKNELIKLEELNKEIDFALAVINGKIIK